MVRVVSQNFSPPRSRHSSGETDWDLAERADSALSALGKKRCELGLFEYESSSDSFWDSEFDHEHSEDICAKNETGNDDINGNQFPQKSDVHSKRKERRRERNKLSAQAYRKRKRQITYNKQQELFVLEEKNKHLQELVNRLEKKTEKAKMYLRGISDPSVDVPNASAESGCAKRNPATTLPSAIEEPAVHHINLNMNKNLLYQPSLSTAGEFHERVEQSADGAVTRKVSAPTDFPNSNFSSLTPFLINANTFVGANSNASTSGFPAHATFRSIVPVKSKNGFYNANMNFKSPILRPSTLQPVPEVPSCLLGETDDNTTPTSSTTSDGNLTSQGDAGIAQFKEEKLPFDSMKMPLCNSNINLNKSQYANDNFMKRDAVTCDNHVKINSFQLLNINGNLNQNSAASKQELFPNLSA